ncbi:unnamed protein product [Symbiodinium natans]|uniref:Ubiquitin-like domain-containing protein n=1 Tax=Symbiodinium natans TaxID=878477 RepID=A0A812V2J3_9DINO|nr:unnamed protein product [Symbiodinium natans]
MVDARVAVEVQKITGETFQCHVDSDATVQQLKTSLAREASVPALCQRLLLRGVSSDAAREHLLPFFACQMQRAVDLIERRNLGELKSLMRPPPDLLDCCRVVLHMLVGNPTMAASRIAHDKVGLPRETDWRACQRMMASPQDLLEAMYSFVEDVRRGHVQAQPMQAAEELAAQLGPRFTPGLQRRLSGAGAAFCEWALAALTFYRLHMAAAAGNEVSVELEDPVPVQLYLACKSVDGLLSLVADIEPAVKVLSSATAGSALQIEALEALGSLGPKSSERALRLLASWLTSSSLDLRKAALHAIQQGWQADDEECATVLLEVLPDFSTGVAAPRQEALEALLHAKPDHVGVLDRIVGGLNVGNEGDQHVSLSYFERVAEAADAEALVQRTLAQLFRDGPGRPPAPQEAIMNALALASARAYGQARAGLLLRLVPTEPHWVQVLAAAAAAKVLREDPELLAAMSACKHNLGTEDQVSLLQSLVALSPAALGEVVASLCLAMEKAEARSRLLVLRALILHAPEGDEGALSLALQYLGRSSSIMRQEGCEGLLLAARLVRKIGAEAAVKESEAMLLDALTGHLARTGDKFLLLTLLSWCRDFSAEVGSSAFVGLAKGFRKQNPQIREVCARAFERLLPFGNAHAATAALVDVIQLDHFDWSRVLAANLLPIAVEAGDSENSRAVPALLELAKDSNLAAA